jgi:hypothetical protein
MGNCKSSSSREKQTGSREGSRGRDTARVLPYSSVESFDASSEAFDDLSDSANLVEFILKLVNLAKDAMEAGNFRIGHFNGIAGAVVLGLGCHLGLSGELQCPTGQHGTMYAPTNSSRLTACHLCWMEYINRSKCALRAWRLEGSSMRRP